MSKRGAGEKNQKKEGTMNKTIDAQVLCPFYLREDKNTIGCEGIIDGTSVITKFPGIAVKKLFMQAHCLFCNGCGCPLADTLNRKYA